MQFTTTAEDMHALASEYDERESLLAWEDFLQEQMDEYLETFLRAAVTTTLASFSLGAKPRSE